MIELAAVILVEPPLILISLIINYDSTAAIRNLILHQDDQEIACLPGVQVTVGLGFILHLMLRLGTIEDLTPALTGFAFFARSLQWDSVFVFICAFKL